MSVPDFDEFRCAVLRDRFLANPVKDRFLHWLEVESAKRRVYLARGSMLWRAQIGADMDRLQFSDTSFIELPSRPYPPARMLPLEHRAKEGRVNPAGSPVVYLATDRETALAELRPWRKVPLSLGEFTTTRDLRVIDFTARRTEDGEIHSALASVFNPWVRLDEAFSAPLDPSQDTANYAPTQVIAELIRRVNDGIVYRSSITNGKCVAVFDRDSLRLTRTAVFEAKSIEYEFLPSVLCDDAASEPECDERWFLNDTQQ